jgi:hypothetical protein
MIISLGSACKVREAIQRHMNLPSLETNIFDWVISNFDGILYFIRNIDTPLNKDDFYDTGQKCLSHRIVNHVNIRFDTLHDVIFDNIYESEVQKLVNKYNRRLKRLKNKILNNKTIHFIHLADCIYNHRIPSKNIYVPTIKEVLNFNKLINQINPNCDYYLHILIPPNNCIIYNTEYNYNKLEVDKLRCNNVFVYYLTQDITKEPYKDQCCHWSWYDVFDNIKLLTKQCKK